MMKNGVTRRDFLARLGRVAGFAGLAALTARLFPRSNTAAPSRRRELCRRCPALEYCSLPGGVETKDALGAPGDRTRLSSPDGGKAPDVRGLCGVRPSSAPSSRWIRREDT